MTYVLFRSSKCGDSIECLTDASLQSTQKMACFYHHSTPHPSTCPWLKLRGSRPFIHPRISAKTSREHGTCIHHLSPWLLSCLGTYNNLLGRDISWQLVSSPSLWAFAISQGRDGLAFLQAFRAMRRGYANGAFHYAVMAFEKA